MHRRFRSCMFPCFRPMWETTFHRNSHVGRMHRMCVCASLCDRDDAMMLHWCSCLYFMAPKRRFWKTERTVWKIFSNDFQTGVAQIEYSPHLKVLRNDVPNGSFGLPKSSFGEHILVYFWTNGNFRKDEQMMRCGFSKHCKVSRKSTSHHLFILPKSSFGMHKLASCYYRPAFHEG